MSPVRVGRKFASFTDAEIDALPEGTAFFADGESAAVVETTGRGLRWCGPLTEGLRDDDTEDFRRAYGNRGWTLTRIGRVTAATVRG